MKNEFFPDPIDCPFDSWEPFTEKPMNHLEIKMFKYLLTPILTIIAVVMFLCCLSYNYYELSSKVEVNKANIVVQHDCILEIQTILTEVETSVEDRDVIHKQAEVIRVLTVTIKRQDAEIAVIIERAIEIQRVNEELQAALIKANRKK